MPLGQALSLGFIPMILAHLSAPLSFITTTSQLRQQTLPEGEPCPQGLTVNIL